MGMGNHVWTSHIGIHVWDRLICVWAKICVWDGTNSTYY